MPLVRIAVGAALSDSDIKAIGDAVHDAMVATISCPPKDRFQIAHSLTHQLCTDEYLDVVYDQSRLVMIQITLNEGRTTELKQALYQAIARNIGAATGIGKNNIIINLVEVKKENWSFGNGIAQYV